MREFEDIGIYGVNERGASQQLVKCPKCGKDKKLNVSIEKKLFHCFRCEYKGGISNAKGSVFNSLPVFDYNYTVKEKTALETFYGFFTKRGITKDILERNKISFAEEIFFGVSGKKEKAICFNYFFFDKLVNVKYRGSGKKFMQAKDGFKTFYKLNDVLSHEVEECIITEGEIDALSFEQAGFKNAISIPEGGINPNSKNLANKMKFLDNTWDYLKHIKKFYLALDSDEVGLTMREELARRIGKDKCYIIKFPDGCKDANDVLVKHSITELITCYKNAEPYPIEGVHRVKDHYERIKYIHENGYPVGPHSGNRKFDELLKHHEGQLVILTGKSHNGKTTFLYDLLNRYSFNHGLKYSVFSPEHAVSSSSIKLLRQTVGKSFLKDYHDSMTSKERDEAIEYLNDHFFFIQPDDGIYKIDLILEKTHELIIKFGINGLVIDSWGKMSHDFGNRTETQYTAYALNKLSNFCKKHNINTYLIAHPTKLEKTGKAKERAIPDLTDINGSIHFENFCDIGLVTAKVLNDDGTYKTLVKTLKVREDYMGYVGSVDMHYQNSSLRFYEIEGDLYLNENRLHRQTKEENYPQQPLYLQGASEYAEDIPF